MSLLFVAFIAAVTLNCPKFDEPYLLSIRLQVRDVVLLTLTNHDLATRGMRNVHVDRARLISVMSFDQLEISCHNHAWEATGNIRHGALNLR